MHSMRDAGVQAACQESCRPSSLHQHLPPTPLTPGLAHAPQTVLVGTGPLNRRVAQTDARPYRDAAMCRMGLQDSPQTRPVVTLMHKEVRQLCRQ